MPFAARNSLRYPGSAASGYDPAHIAASSKVRFSGVSIGGNFLNLLTGKMGTVGGAAVGILDATIGSALKTGANNDRVSFSGLPAVADAQGTIAGIVSYVDTGGGLFFESDATAGGGEGGLTVGASSFFFTVGKSNVAAINSTIAAVNNVPYFQAISWNDATGVNFVVVRLDTGVVLSQFVASVTTALASDGTYLVGNSALGTAFSGRTAAAMYSAQYMSIPQLLGWAKSPWDFWYPPRAGHRRILDAVAASGAAPGLPRSSLNLLGVGQ